MRIWLVFIAVGMLFIVACGEESNSETISSLLDTHATVIALQSDRLPPPTPIVVIKEVVVEKIVEIPVEVVKEVEVIKEVHSSECDCSSNVLESSDASPTSVPSTPSISQSYTGVADESIAQRFDLYAQFLSTEKYRDAYTYISPDMKEVCEVDDFLIQTATGIEFVKAFNGGSDSVVSYEVKNIRQEGDVAFVESDMFINGEKLDFSSDSEDSAFRLVFKNGEWWVEPKTWAEGC